jgi:hypothetical protein
MGRKTYSKGFFKYQQWIRQFSDKAYVETYANYATQFDKRSVLGL